jgi:DNA primase
MKASIKALNIFKNFNLEAKVISFPENMDPDDYITKFGKAKFKDKINNADDYFEFLNKYYSNKFNIGSNKGKVKYIENFLENIKNISNSIERELIIEKISDVTNISKENLLNEYSKKNSKNKSRYKKKKENKGKKKTFQDINLESYLDKLFNLASNDEELFEYIISKYDEEFSTIFGKEYSKNYKPKENHKKTDVEMTTEELDFLSNKIIIKYKEKELSILRERLNKDPNNQDLLAEINKVYKEINNLRQGGSN